MNGHIYFEIQADDLNVLPASTGKFSAGNSIIMNRKVQSRLNTCGLKPGARLAVC